MTPDDKAAMRKSTMFFLTDEINRLKRSIGNMRAGMHLMAKPGTWMSDNRAYERDDYQRTIKRTILRARQLQYALEAAQPDHLNARGWSDYGIPSALKEYGDNYRPSIYEAFIIRDPRD